MLVYYTCMNISVLLSGGYYFLILYYYTIKKTLVKFNLSLRSSINIVCCVVVHHCSHTAHTCINDDKLVTRYE